MVGSPLPMHLHFCHSSPITFSPLASRFGRDLEAFFTELEQVNTNLVVSADMGGGPGGRQGRRWDLPVQRAAGAGG